LTADIEHRKERGYPVEEVCQILGVSRPTVIRWIRSGRLPAIRIGGRWRVPAEEIEKRLAYKLVRHAPGLIFNGPLSEAEVESITSTLAHTLRQLGAPVRTDGLRNIVLGKIPVDGLLWRYLDRALKSNALEKEDPQARAELSEAWDRYLAGESEHPFTGGFTPAGPMRSFTLPRGSHLILGERPNETTTGSETENALPNEDERKS